MAGSPGVVHKAERIEPAYYLKCLDPVLGRHTTGSDSCIGRLIGKSLRSPHYTGFMTGSLASKTCLYVAAGRALGARDPDAAVRNPDYLAERLLGPKERALVAEQACV